MAFTARIQLFYFWNNNGNWCLGQMINFMKNIGLAGGFLALAANGPGKLSVDAWFASRRPRQFAHG